MSFEADYNSLPDVFKRRIDRFRNAGGEVWEKKYGEYEMICCIDAVKIALTKSVRDYEEFSKKPWEQQVKLVPDLSREHSGNSFMKAVRLAYLFTNNPELVVWDHAAIAVLTGCDECFCDHSGAPEGMYGK